MSNKLKRSLDKNFSYTEYNPKNKIQNMKFMINGGDIYVMSEKATGQDWKKKVRSVPSSCPSGCRREPLPTLRHAAGSVKYTKVRIK